MRKPAPAGHVAELDQQERVPFDPMIRQGRRSPSRTGATHENDYERRTLKKSGKPVAVPSDQPSARAVRADTCGGTAGSRASPGRRDGMVKEAAVQTFVAYADFARTAQVLDSSRLGKQRVEVIQIVRTLTVPGYAWASHPAVLMWKGHEEALAAYGASVVRAWTALGFGDTCGATIMADLAKAGHPTPPRPQAALAAAGELPGWLG